MQQKLQSSCLCKEQGVEWVSPNDMFKGEGIAKEKLTHTSSLEQRSTTTKHSLITSFPIHQIGKESKLCISTKTYNLSYVAKLQFTPSIKVFLILRNQGNEVIVQVRRSKHNKSLDLSGKGERVLRVLFSQLFSCPHFQLLRLFFPVTSSHIKNQSCYMQMLKKTNDCLCVYINR